MPRPRLVGLLLLFSFLISSISLAEKPYLYLVTKKSGTRPLHHAVAGVQTSTGKRAFVHQTNNAGSLFKLIRGGAKAHLGSATGYPGRKGAITYRMEVSSEQADRALEHVEKQIASGDGANYNILRNSCSTVAGKVLRAGGVKPPFWAISPTMLRRWFRLKGAKPVPADDAP